jgi:hypothetical protein
MIFLSLHQTIRVLVREWYFTSVIPVVFVIIGIVMEIIHRSLITWKIQKHWRIAGAIIILLTATGTGTYRVTQNSQWRSGWVDQLALYEGAQWIAQNTPTDAIIGAYNAGIMGFVSERRVINLDGVVNAEVIEYRLTDTMPDYLIRRHISFLADFSGVLTSEYSASDTEVLGITLFQEVRGETATVLVYQLDPDS